ncbi:MAG: tRNA (adenosine(37)-N6)-threonylcarbamoyltransferase complex dimerization subunit type 1 TsaB [Cyclobacteriaceae bacterium]|nr:tRNA (adenosine(37)-N6)-threonylcarbamoyltransferase complex dimerization subunit type 1 TsaB [Cyclobacteriaceae bacterium]
MSLVLSLESSTSVCSVALHEDGELIIEREVHEPQAAAALLTPMIEGLFQSTGLLRNQLSAVAVSSGPGSYTGLRIGVSTAKGICFALDLPLITLDSLHVLASAVSPKGDGRWLCPMIDARRMEVYTCLLTETLEVVEATRPVIVDEQSFGTILESHRIDFFGNGATKCEAVIRHPNATFMSGLYPRAASMGLLAFRKLGAGEFADVRNFEPAYLKEFAIKTKKA